MSGEEPLTKADVEALRERVDSLEKDLAEVVQFLKHAGYPNVWGTSRGTARGSSRSRESRET